MARESKIVLVGCDAGGTMTDIVLVDSDGEFVTGKAATTPQDESVGFWGALEDSLAQWKIDLAKEGKQILPDVEAIVYAGTTMLNVLLTRRGKETGIICTKGFEDTLLHERGAQTHAGYGYQDKWHKVAHIHNVPLVPKKLIKGVTERISIFGEQVVPLYEDEARRAVAELLDRGVERIVVWFLCSYANSSHEKRCAEIAKEVMKERGRHVTLYLSCELMPLWREVSRLNALVLQAYGAEPAREQLFRIERKLQDGGYKNPLQIVLADGSIANVRFFGLFRAYFSGPISGVLGGVYLSQEFDMPNIVCADMGGTSFDVGLIMGGKSIISREVEIGRMFLNIPTLVVDSIGAGTGQYLSVDPESKRFDIGPGSAGADPGPVCYNMGNEIPTVMDCALILGILNPDYYLGGKMKLHKDMALNAIKDKCAAKLGLDPYRFAEGVIDLINIRMREHINTILSVRGYSSADYYLIGYGGAGPMFLAGFTEGMPFKGVFTVPWAAAFSAFGTTTTDFTHRYQMSTMTRIASGADEAAKVFLGQKINALWEELERIAIREMEEEGFKREDIKFKQVAYLRYAGQLEDLEVVSPVSRVNTAEDLDKLITAFEETYSSVYTYAARYPEGGYQMLEVGLVAWIRKLKPKLRKHQLEDKLPESEAFKGEREVYVRGHWKKAKVYEMDLLKPGNEVNGLAIIEAPATTLLVPQGKKIEIDEYRRYWLKAV